MDEIKVMDEQKRNEILNPPVEHDTTQYIVTQLGGEQYGIDTKYISNIIRMTKITRVPKVSNYIKGVINVRGVVIPTISLRLKMGLPEDVISKKTRIIILTLEQHESIGVLVDEVKEVVTLDEEHIERMGYEKDDKERFLSGVGKSGFLTTLYILMVPILGLLFKRKVKPVLWLCIVIATCGMYFLCVTEAGSINIGDLFLIACAFLFSVQIMIVDHYVQTVDGVRLSLVQFFVVAVISAVCMFLFEEVDPVAIGNAWFSIFYAGVLSSGIAFTLQIVAQKNLNPTVASLIMSLESVFAALAGAVFGERLSSNEILGCVLVFVAIILAQLPVENLFKKKA